MSESTYEHYDVDDINITIDISLLHHTSDAYINATEIATQFEVSVHEFMQLRNTKKLEKLILKSVQDRIKHNLGDCFCFGDSLYLNVKRGKRKGVWMHHVIALEFANWCSPVFRWHLKDFINNRIEAYDDFWVL